MAIAPHVLKILSQCYLFPDPFLPWRERDLEGRRTGVAECLAKQRTARTRGRTYQIGFDIIWHFGLLSVEQ